MKESRLKIDIYVGLITTILFTLLLIMPIFLGMVGIGYYIIVGILFMGSLISYYKGLIPAIGLAMIVDFIYVSTLLTLIFLNKTTLSLNNIIGIILITLCYISFGCLGEHISRLQRNNKELALQNEMLVTVDADTGLQNRVAFTRDLKIYMKLCPRHELPLTLMIIKLRYDKRLKKLLSSHWYHILLKEVAKVVSKTLREEDMTYILREEGSFAVLLITDEANGKYVKNRLIDKINQIEFEEGTPLHGIQVEIKVAFKQYTTEITSPLEYMERTNKELEYDV